MRYLKILEEFTDDVNNINELISKLNEYSIPINEWGTKNAKTVQHLLNEIKDKECSIVDEDGKLVRYIEFVGVKVYYDDEDGNKWYLKEFEQIFKDGRTRRRSMKSSVSEKMKSGEDPLESAVRGVAEELGITVQKEQLQDGKDISFNGDSASYPGLQTKYKGYQFTMSLTKEQYNPEGYVEKQSDKSTYFKWMKL